MAEPPLTDSQSITGDTKSEKEKSVAEDTVPGNEGSAVPKSSAGSKPASAVSGKGGSQSGDGDRMPSPVMSGKDNPSADLRNMRRIIAEDPDWSLATVPLLVELCTGHIVSNFESRYIIRFIDVGCLSNYYNIIYN